MLRRAQSIGSPTERLGSSPDVRSGHERPGRGKRRIAGSSPDCRPRLSDLSVKACHKPRSRPAPWRLSGAPSSASIPAAATGYILADIAFGERDLKLYPGKICTSYWARVPALIPVLRPGLSVSEAQKTNRRRRHEQQGSD